MRVSVPKRGGPTRKTNLAFSPHPGCRCIKSCAKVIPLTSSFLTVSHPRARCFAELHRSSAQVGAVPAEPGLPKHVEDSLLHSFRIPPALVKKDYDRLADFFRDAARRVVDEGERLGIAREEAVHNILFAMCFNSFGGMKILFPSLVKWLGRAGARTHGRPATEVRDAVRAHGGGEVTMKALAEMPLVKSAVYEAQQIEPPVAMQYGRRPAAVDPCPTHGSTWRPC